MFDPQLTAQLADRSTPFYFYDSGVLIKTLEKLTVSARKHDFRLHYAFKANANPTILNIIHDYGLGADCVSGNEIKLALNTGFSPDSIVFAGVGKTDKEIELSISNDIFCINCESVQEIMVINQIASGLGKTARIALRINPGIDAMTHPNITTGQADNKFGIHLNDLDELLNAIPGMTNIMLTGLHFHIGSQITTFEVFLNLCKKINDIQEILYRRNIPIGHINLGGGLGIDYDHPEMMPPFEEYFILFARHLKIYPDQTVHFEPGRSVVGQCGSLITKVLFTKNAPGKQFAIVDAGFTELLRPALYHAYHKIENLVSRQPEQPYEVVGPICETTDSFGSDVSLPACTRGDLLAIRSTGAYGEVMASHYNQRELYPAGFSYQH
ncbi:MAG: diaminopimelate decarboxylase [Bacteroidales bacterium]|jgi:diaminopimelate decarboxylase|nr:diaminopimelate decarboxylase [Bacteroidales bacterium]